jgi:hypothetical protein
LTSSTHSRQSATNKAIKIIQPFTESTLTVEWMKEQKWTLLQRKAWESLLKKKKDGSGGPAVLLSDNVSQTQSLEIGKVQLAPTATAVATASTDFNGMYANVTSEATAAPAPAAQQAADQQSAVVVPL